MEFCVLFIYVCKQKFINVLKSNYISCLGSYVILFMLMIAYALDFVKFLIFVRRNVF